MVNNTKNNSINYFELPFYKRWIIYETIHVFSLLFLSDASLGFITNKSFISLVLSIILSFIATIAVFSKNIYTKDIITDRVRNLNTSEKITRSLGFIVSIGYLIFLTIKFI